jgi:hypothetical protein
MVAFFIQCLQSSTIIKLIILDERLVCAIAERPVLCLLAKTQVIFAILFDLKSYWFLLDL